jgi:hypothetical protein
MSQVAVMQGSMVRFHTGPENEWEVIWVSSDYLALAREENPGQWMWCVVSIEGPVRYELLTPFPGERREVNLMGVILCEGGLFDLMMKGGLKEDVTRQLPADIRWVDGVDYIPGCAPDAKVSVRDRKALYEMN